MRSVSAPERIWFLADVETGGGSIARELCSVGRGMTVDRVNGGRAVETGVGRVK